MPNTKFSSYDHILSLFSKTDENGYLMIPGWDYDSEDESEILYSCEMRWNEIDSKECAKLFSVFENQIRVIEQLNKKQNINEDNAENILGESYYSTWKTFLKPFKAELNDEVFEKDFIGEKLTEEEQKIYDQYRTDVYKEACERLGKKDFSYEVIIRAMRFYHLLILGAPEVVIDNELKMLTEAYVLYKYCLSLTRIQGIAR